MVTSRDILIEYIRLELEGKKLPALGLAVVGLAGLNSEFLTDKPPRSSVQAPKQGRNRVFEPDPVVQDEPEPPTEEPKARPRVRRDRATPELLNLIKRSAESQDIDPAFLEAIAYVESRYRPDIIYGDTLSSSGAEGMMQFVKSTAKDMGLENPSDPEQAAPAAARYVRQLLDEFDGDYDLAAAAYNVGPRAVRRALNAGGLENNAQAVKYVASVNQRMESGPFTSE